MINLDKHTIFPKCPKCFFSNKISLKQVRINASVICRGCKCNIRLEDHFNSTMKSLRSFRRSMQSLENELAKLGTLTLNINI